MCDADTQHCHQIYIMYDLMVSASTLCLQRVQEAVAKEPWHCTTFLIPATYNEEEVCSIVFILIS
jgi:hypothetical protein